MRRLCIAAVAVGCCAAADASCRGCIAAVLEGRAAAADVGFRPPAGAAVCADAASCWPLRSTRSARCGNCVCRRAFCCRRTTAAGVVVPTTSALPLLLCGLLERLVLLEGERPRR